MQVAISLTNANISIFSTTTATAFLPGDSYVITVVSSDLFGDLFSIPILGNNSENINGSHSWVHASAGSLSVPAGLVGSVQVPFSLLDLQGSVLHANSWCCTSLCLTERASAASHQFLVSLSCLEP